MENPLLTPSALPFGAPQFDKIRNEHYMPAFRTAIAAAKAGIDAIVSDPEPPTFANTIEALEYNGQELEQVCGIFYNLMEADVDDEMQKIAEEVSPLLTEYSMYQSLNAGLFARVKAVHAQKDSLGLPQDSMKLLEDTYRSFARNGANLPEEDKKAYSACAEELSLATLEFSRNVLDATNAYHLHLQDPSDLEGLPSYVVDMASTYAREKGVDGWVFTLDHASYTSFMKFSTRRELREELWRAYNSRAVGGAHDNTQVIRRIVELRVRIARLLGYETYADYALEERMAKDQDTVTRFLDRLLEPSLPFARKDVRDVLEFARKQGWGEDSLQPWDFPFWSEKYREAEYELNEEQLKPYFRLENCIDAVFGLAHRLYGLTFSERKDLPVYHKDVKVYDVQDESGRHMALFYADFFPRASKRGGAWMTEFRGQSIVDGVELRPFISIVTNFTRPTATDPALLTHGELTTLLHEFGHALHGILAEGRYPSQTGTSVARDFVELPSQIMENWAFEPEFLDTFARDYRTGETIPAELVEKITATRNFQAGYLQVRQLQFGVIDMAWHTLTSLPEEESVAFEKKELAGCAVLPSIAGTAVSPAFSHIFAGGYAAGYYSYKWAEVLEADAFSLFQEKGIFNREVAESFRRNILSRGGTEDAAVLYRNFRGRDPQPEALMEKLGLI